MADISFPGVDYVLAETPDRVAPCIIYTGVPTTLRMRCMADISFPGVDYVLAETKLRK
jgi:hypothetical protein